MSPRNQRVIWLHGQDPIRLSYHPAKFSSHRHFGSVDIVILVCPMISQDHMIKDDVA